MDREINCKEHGKQDAYMICQHLKSITGLEYAVVKVAFEDDDYETAMCVNCESLLLKEQAWSDKLNDFAGWTLVCSECYQKILSNHKLVAEGNMK